jgi:PBP1b-binding outer membrane lipoprotein LpoB
MRFLYEQFDTLKNMGMFNVDISTFINDNLQYALMPYQTEHSNAISFLIQMILMQNQTGLIIPAMKN